MDARRQRAILQRIARRAMIDRGLLPDFSAEALAELDRIMDPPAPGTRPARDQRSLPWASIDNDDSRDLDQLTVAETMPGGTVKILVAVADVDALVKIGSAIDAHARQNTTSVYTAGEIFPMLPERLSTDLTSLGFQEDRPAIVVEMVFGEDGSLRGSDLYGATVRNHAKLAYNGVAAWLEGKGPAPGSIEGVEGLAENLRIQDRVAQQLKAVRHEHGALDLETIEARPVFDGEEIRDLEAERKNRAKELIEDFMIAANGVTARYLSDRKFPSLRRVVRSPKRWERIVEVASRYGGTLPAEPDPKALGQFLAGRKAADPLRFPDLSLTIIKLMGAGEYVPEFPEETAAGHFGLAVRDYTHSTAPNRRYPDLITQRLLKAAIAGSPIPYGRDELSELGRHCTEKEDDANKVERLVGKSAAAMLLAPRSGERFDSIVTGASEKGTWVRLLQPPVEGRLIHGFEGADVGDRLRVQLVHTDVERGYIDFKRVD
jgi:VacB/RNase II family 3'-5' exoribonuclease